LKLFELVSKIAKKKTTPKPILSVLANIPAQLQAKQTPSKLLRKNVSVLANDRLSKKLRRVLWLFF